MTHLSEEIRTQPDNWRAVATRLDEVSAALPTPGERVLVVGCGTSYYMAQAYAAARAASGQGVTHAVAASELIDGAEGDYDRLIALTRSGTTTEVIGVLNRVKGAIRTTGIVATPGTPVTELVDEAILLPEVDEQSVVQTRFATTALSLLWASVGIDPASAADQAAAVLAEADPLADLGDIAALEQVTFLGRGRGVGLAEEAALKLRESAQFWTESYPALEYRHGPISIAQPNRIVWVFGEAPSGLAGDVAATGATFVCTDREPLAELVRVHLLCERLADLKGLNPDAPRHLTRSIILDEEPADSALAAADADVAPLAP